MAEIKETLNKSRKNSAASGTVPLFDIFFMTLRRWPLILLSVLICVGAAYVHLLRIPNVYSRSAEILIKDDAKGNSAGAEEFANLGLFQSNTNIQNEMANLKAKDLMEEVVRRLGLDINYYHSGRFHDGLLAQRLQLALQAAQCGVCRGIFGPQRFVARHRIQCRGAELFRGDRKSVV